MAADFWVFLASLRVVRSTFFWTSVRRPFTSNERCWDEVSWEVSWEESSEESWEEEVQKRAIFEVVYVLCGELERPRLIQVICLVCLPCIVLGINVLGINVLGINNVVPWLVMILWMPYLDAIFVTAIFVTAIFVTAIFVVNEDTALIIMVMYIDVIIVIDSLLIIDGG